MRSNIKKISAVIAIIIVIAVLIFQINSLFKIQDQLSSITLDMKTNELTIEQLKQEIEINKQESQTKIASLTSGLEQSTSQISELQQDLSNIQIESQDFSAIIDEVIPSVVSIITPDSQGSGVIISEDGYIVTNYHVVDGANRIKALTYDREFHDAQVIGISKGLDIALLRIDENNLEFLEFGDSDEVKVGQHVIALGNPAGLSFTVTEGIVSATNRIGPNNLQAYIQVDVPINPGNSGGPLVNIKKEIIGINNFKLGGSFESLGFAIDSNHVKDVVDKIFKELEKLE